MDGAMANGVAPSVLGSLGDMSFRTAFTGGEGAGGGESADGFDLQGTQNMMVGAGINIENRPADRRRGHSA